MPEFVEPEARDRVRSGARSPERSLGYAKSWRSRSPQRDEVVRKATSTSAKSDNAGDVTAQPRLVDVASQTDTVESAKNADLDVEKLLKERAELKQELLREKEISAKMKAEYVKVREELAWAKSFAQVQGGQTFQSARRRRPHRYEACFRRVFWFCFQDEPGPAIVTRNVQQEMGLLPVDDPFRTGSAPPLPMVAEAEEITNSMEAPVPDVSIWHENTLNRARDCSAGSFQSARSVSRDASIGSAPLRGFWQRRASSRSISRSFERTSTLPVGMQESPLKMFRQSVAEALGKLSLIRDLEDPVIQAMAAKSSSDPRSNASITTKLIQENTDVLDLARAKLTALTFRNLILSCSHVLNPLRDTEMSRLVEIFENQWFIKVRPGMNKIIDGRRVQEDYEPSYLYEVGTSCRQGASPFPLAVVMERDQRNHKPAGEGVLWAQRILELIEGLLRALFELVPSKQDEDLNQYLSRLPRTHDWRGYWRDNYSNSRCRREVLGFVVGKLVDAKMKGSPVMLLPPAMVEIVFENSVKKVDEFLYDLRLTMRILDLLL